MEETEIEEPAMELKLDRRTGIHLLRHQGWRWKIAHRAGEFVDERSLPGPVPPPGAEVLREAPGRVVYRMKLANGRSVVVKSYREVSTGDRVRRLVSTRAATEWDMLRRLADRGVPVPVRLALGQKKGASVLVLDDLSAFETLEAAMVRLENGSVARRTRLAECVAELLLRMHRGGYQHRDLHPGNIMVPVAGGDGFVRELIILDLHHGVLRRQLSLEQRFEDLVDLDLYFAWHGRRADRVRCARRYVGSLMAERHADDPAALRRETRRTIRSLGKTTLLRSRKFWLARDERSAGGNRVFSMFDLGAEGRGVARAGDEGLPELLRRVDRELEAPLAPEATLLKDGTSATTALVPLPGTGDAEPERMVFLKRYNRKGTLENAKSFVRGTRASRAFHVGWSLEVRGIPSPRVLAYLDRPGGRSALVTEALTGSRNFADMLVHGDGTGVTASRPNWRSAVLVEVVLILKKMHICGVSHRDLKTVNLLVDSSGGRPQPVIVDLDGVVVHPDVPPWTRRVRDLGRLMADALERGAVNDRAELRDLLSRYLAHIVDERLRLDQLVRGVESECERHRLRRGQREARGGGGL